MIFSLKYIFIKLLSLGVNLNFDELAYSEKKLNENHVWD